MVKTAQAAANPLVRRARYRIGGDAVLKIESLDRAQAVSAGVDGVLLRVSRSDGVKDVGPARFTLDYGAFRWAYGGDWASRLSLWALPACALSSLDAAECRGRKLTSANDAASGTVSAVVNVELPAATTFDLQSGASGVTAAITPSSGGTLLALSASASGAGGDYPATSLSPAATWSAGGNLGDFSWSYRSYPLRVPPSLGGPAPKIERSYSSSSVDGRAARRPGSAKASSGSRGAPCSRAPPPRRGVLRPRGRRRDRERRRSDHLDLEPRLPESPGDDRLPVHVLAAVVRPAPLRLRPGRFDRPAQRCDRLQGVRDHGHPRLRGAPRQPIFDRWTAARALPVAP